MKLVVFSPLAAFAVYAAYALAAPGPRPFFLRWIDVSMAFTLALVATLVLKKLLLGGGEGGEEDGKDGNEGEGKNGGGRNP